MILIFSNEQEPTTDRVIDWLLHLGASFERINSEDLIDQSQTVSIDPAGHSLVMGGRSIEPARVNACWYRRWYRFQDLGLKVRTLQDYQLWNETLMEARVLSNMVFHMFMHAEWLTEPWNADLENKLITLQHAVHSGFRIPETKVTNTRSELESFLLRQENGVVLKPAGDPSGFRDKKQGLFYRSFPEAIDLQTVDEFPERFFPSLFQEKIRKQYEIRVFYLDGKCYATGLFHPKTHDIDIKLENGLERDSVTMSRMKLNGSTEQKIRRLMTSLRLNAGSIDLLVDHGDHTYFLEINPVGQFLGYGTAVNYALEKRVAEWLLQKDLKNDPVQQLLQ